MSSNTLSPKTPSAETSKSAPPSLPAPPLWLDPSAQAKWVETLPQLVDQLPGTLDALAQYCVAWSSWTQAVDDGTKLKWSRCCRQWAVELKLTPKGKSVGKTAARPIDPILMLLRKPKIA